MASARGNTANMELVDRFRTLDLSDFPDFHAYDKPLERALWVLWVAKDKLGVKGLTAKQVALIIRGFGEINTDAKSISRALNRAGDKIYTHRQNRKVFYEIMRPGKDYLSSGRGMGWAEVFYFEPGKRYTCRRLLSKDILNDLRGELRVVDPYCDVGTLDVLSNAKDKVVKLLTRMDNLNQQRRTQFLRELQDFKSENPKMEFRNYPYADIHDRYIIASEHLVILGHSIKDLGAKESFAVVLKKDAYKDLAEALSSSFDCRWKQANQL